MTYFLVEDNEVIMTARVLWMGEKHMVVKYAWIDPDTNRLRICVDVRPIGDVWGKR